MRSNRVAATGIAVALLISACGSDPVTDASKSVEFTPCSETECSGTLPSGAEFEILLPEDWGGSLAIFSHGLRPVTVVQDIDGEEKGTTSNRAEPGSPTSTVSAGAATAGPEPAPLWSGEDKNIADAMLQGDYAIAGASPKSTGWAVSEQIVAAEELRDYFVKNVALPNRTYVWGEATGGLASVRLAELHPDWVSGAAALCAPMSGPRPTFDLSLDVTYAIQQLLLPKIKLVDYASEEEARRTYDRISGKISKISVSGDSADAAALAFIGAVGRLPGRTQTEAGNNAISRLRAIVEGIKTQVLQSTVQRYAFEQLVGGNPSGNAGTDYSERLTPSQAARVNDIDAEALPEMYLALKNGQRISADPEAESAAAAQGELVGSLSVPLLTLHNASDPVYIAASESWYRVRALDHGSAANANYVDLFVLPPVSYDSESPAPEGAGNCVFTPRTVLGVMILLNDWVRRGQYPGQDTVGEAFANGQVTITYSPGPWPLMNLSPTQSPFDGKADSGKHDSSTESESVGSPGDG